MFVVIYSFKIKKGRDQDFISSWQGLTKLIYKHEGSLGSRLHKKSELEYIAYAQWPDKNTWKNSGDSLPKEADQFRQLMRASCESIDTLYELDSVKDLLKDKVS